MMEGLVVALGLFLGLQLLQKLQGRDRRDWGHGKAATGCTKYNGSSLGSEPVHSQDKSLQNENQTIRTRPCCKSKVPGQK